MAAGLGRERPSAVSRRSAIGAPRSYRSASARPSTYGTSSRTSSNRSEKSSAIRALAARRAPRPVSRGTRSARGNACAMRRRPMSSRSIDLVEHELARNRRRHRSRRAPRRPRRSSRAAAPRAGRVGDVQHEVGDERLLERRREPLDELRRQTADEADRVGDEVALSVVLERPRRRVERLEQPVVHGCVRARSARSAASTSRRSCSRRERWSGTLVRSALLAPSRPLAARASADAA